MLETKEEGDLLREIRRKEPSCVQVDTVRCHRAVLEEEVGSAAGGDEEEIGGGQLGGQVACHLLELEALLAELCTHVRGKG